MAMSDQERKERELKRRTYVREWMRAWRASPKYRKRQEERAQERERVKAQWREHWPAIPEHDAFTASLAAERAAIEAEAAERGVDISVIIEERFHDTTEA
jgi:hypothetical protein